MPLSPKTRIPLTAAGLATCVGLGCVGAPQTVEDPPPPPIACPAGAVQTYRTYRTRRAIYLSLVDDASSDATVHHRAPIRARLIEDWGEFPKGTPLIGRTWFGRDRVYGRFTELLLPSGEHVPICLDLYWNGFGVPMRPGHTRTTARIPGTPDALRVLDNELP